MAMRDRDAVEKYHDRVAGIYDTIYDGSPYWEIVFDITWKHIKRFLPRSQPSRCLDVGCGTGRWGLKIIKSGFNCDFLDISHKMLDQVGKKLDKLPHIRNEPELFHTSLADMSMIEDETYDFIVGQGDPLGSAGKPDRTLKEICRVLKPGGTMVMSIDNIYGGMFHFFKNDDIDGLEKFIKNGRTNWVTDDESEQYEVTAFTPARLRKMCEARGLEFLSLIGKTVLPLRRFRGMLEDKEGRERLQKLEEKLNSVEAMLGNAAHLEFAARKPLEQ